MQHDMQFGQHTAGWLTDDVRRMVEDDFRSMPRVKVSKWMRDDDARRWQKQLDMHRMSRREWLKKYYPDRVPPTAMQMCGAWLKENGGDVLAGIATWAFMIALPIVCAVLGG